MCKATRSAINTEVGHRPIPGEGGRRGQTPPPPPRWLEIHILRETVIFSSHFRPRKEPKCSLKACKGKKVKVEVYSLVIFSSHFEALLTRLHTITPWSQDLFIHKPSQLPGEHTARLPFSAHGTIQTHKPSLSYLVPVVFLAIVNGIPEKAPDRFKFVNDITLVSRSARKSKHWRVSVPTGRQWSFSILVSDLTPSNGSSTWHGLEWQYETIF